MINDNDAAFVLFQQILLTSSEDSSDEEYEVIRGPQVRKPRIRNFITEVVDSYTNAEFREHFRMYRTTFNYLLLHIGNNIISEETRGRHPVPSKDQLLFTLWYFSTPECYRSICSRFNVGKATGLRIVRRVTKTLLDIAPTVIKWPSGEYVDSVKNAFTEMGFPNTIGALDGCYIPIPIPKENGLSYICRKNFAALILQAVCDNQMLFTHCYVGEVGSTHDATVLRRSELFSYLTTERWEKFQNDSHLVGDKAYPCLQTLMVPYKDNGHLRNSQKQFNFFLSSVRCTIERAFALLKKRFRCLHFFDIKDVEWGCKYILACCVLHNICILQNDVIELNEPVPNDNEAYIPVVGDVDRNIQRLGTVKRDNICQTFGE